VTGAEAELSGGEDAAPSPRGDDSYDEDAGARDDARRRAGEEAGSGVAALGQGAKRRPAWVDEDAAGVQASVVKRKTLRKLREAEDEAEITGSEFEARLRKHHAKLHREPKVSPLRAHGTRPRLARRRPGACRSASPTPRPPPAVGQAEEALGRGRGG